MQESAAQYDPSIDYYEILQVHPHAHQEVIKRAYRTIVGLLNGHPDLGGSHDQAVRVNEAYAVLSSPETRRAYDAERRKWQQRRERPDTRTGAPPTSPVVTPHAGTAQTRTRRTAAGVATHHGAHRGGRMVCAQCGAFNRLPREANPQRALCGKCQAPLTHSSSAGGVTHLPSADVQLTPAMTLTLQTDGEVRVQRSAMPRDGRLYCLRCRHSWQATPGQPLPDACPQCHSPHWGDFRLFCCRLCGHRFSTHNLPAWPYWLYPECPSCGQRHWHPGCERSPLRWLLNLVGIWQG